MYFQNSLVDRIFQERIPHPTQDANIVAEQTTEDVFDRVMKEAFEEAKAKSPDIEIADVDADAEMMAEINALFDKAAKEMKKAAADIKNDQVRCTMLNNTLVIYHN